MKRLASLACCIPALALAGCPSDDSPDGDEGSTGDSPTSTSSTTTTTGPTTSTTATTTTGETDPDTDTDPTIGTESTTISTDTDSTTTGDTDTDTDAESSSSTGPGIQEITLQFDARVGDETAACGTNYDGVGSESSEIQFRDLRFYVSNIRLVNDADEEVPLELTQDGMWQVEDVALLDFEDGTAACSDTGNDALNSTVVGEVPGGTYTGVRFDLGVPNELNHTDVNLADSPLNILEMNWNWLAGRKFVRIDLNVDELPPNNNWNIHLGSQGCMNAGPDPMMPPDADCTRPQRPAIALDSFDPTTNVIVADIGALLNGVNITENIAGPAGCQSLMADNDMNSGTSDCDDLFPNYGMDWATGDCADNCSAQTFFSVE